MWKDFALNPSLDACEWDKDCEICKYLKKFTCAKCFNDSLVVMCDEIIDTQKTTSISSTIKTNY